MLTDKNMRPLRSLPKNDTKSNFDGVSGGRTMADKKIFQIGRDQNPKTWEPSLNGDFKCLRHTA
jgi:hypothetical protein